MASFGLHELAAEVRRHGSLVQIELGEDLVGCPCHARPLVLNTVIESRSVKMR